MHFDFRSYVFLPISQVKHDPQNTVAQACNREFFWHSLGMAKNELTPKEILNLQREYVLSVSKFVKPSNHRKLEAIAADDAESVFADYFTDLYVPTTLCMIFMVYSEDDPKIAKRFWQVYSLIGHEFLEINEACNRWNLSVLKVAKTVKEVALPYINQGRSKNVRYTFEQEVSDLAVELRASQLSKLSVKSQEKTITDYFAQIGLKI
jgi:hypothetical protein